MGKDGGSRRYEALSVFPFAFQNGSFSASFGRLIDNWAFGFPVSVDRFLIEDGELVRHPFRVGWCFFNRYGTELQLDWCIAAVNEPRVSS